MENGGGTGDLDRFGDRADFEREIHFNDGRDFEDDFRDHFGLKSGHRGRDFVASRIEREDAKVAGGVGLDGACDSGAFILHCNGGVSDDARLGIEYRAEQCSIRGLRTNGAREQTEPEGKTG